MAGGTRVDGNWTPTLGPVSGRLFSSPVPGGDNAARLRLCIMQSMDIGLVSGIPAFFVSPLSVRDVHDRALLRIQTFEPVSENLVLSFDFAKPPVGPLRSWTTVGARTLADGVYVVEGANDEFSVANGCNIINTGFITTGGGVLVINTGTSRRYGEPLRALIKRTTVEPVVQVLHSTCTLTTFSATRSLPTCRSAPPRPSAPASSVRPPAAKPTRFACAATG